MKPGKNPLLPTISVTNWKIPEEMAKSMEDLLGIPGVTRKLSDEERKARESLEEANRLAIARQQGAR